MTSKPLTKRQLVEMLSRVRGLTEPFANPSWETLKLAHDVVDLLNEVERLKAHAEAMADQLGMVLSHIGTTLNTGPLMVDVWPLDTYRKDYPKEEA